ncbi:unnamed protein product [Rhizoctonia solani]|uniref:BTB domain-containing protein n=1 Tax=Rhizoctonia solani TaxID=456999 RepID=A0A8H3DJR5_9AGAM|nr:unnamed protein product [Rhizoctonia solani]
MSDIDPTPTDDKLLGSKRLSAFFVEDPLIVIQVESTLFKVHKRLLMKSETFLDMHKAPETTDDKPEEGSSPDHPIILDSVSASDFEAFLTALYAGYHPSLPGQPAPKLQTPLLLTASRLAHKWNFSDLQIYLLPLIEEALGDLDRIMFAREFTIQGWLEPAYKNLCQRSKPINIEEARKLGIDALLMISHMREQFRPPKSANESKATYCQSCVGAECMYWSGTCTSCGGGTASSSYNHRVDPQGSSTSTALSAKINRWVADGCVWK